MHLQKCGVFLNEGVNPRINCDVKAVLLTAKENTAG